MESCGRARGATDVDINGGTLDLIDDAYNANPTSLRAATNLAKQTPQKNRFWVT